MKRHFSSALPVSRLIGTFPLLSNGPSTTLTLHHSGTQDGATPAFIAAQAGHLDILTFLGACGVDLDAPTAFGTPFAVALRLGHGAVLAFLRSR